MTFSEFVQRLFPYCNNGRIGAKFVEELLKNSSDPDNPEFLNKDEATYRKYFNESTSNAKSKRGLPKAFASFVYSNLKDENFEDFIINNTTDDGLNGLCEKFKKELPCSSKKDIAQKLAILFREILFEIANNKRSKANLMSYKNENSKNFDKTVRDANFDNVFIEVPQKNDLGLLNNNHIKTFHLCLENKTFSFTGLNGFLKKNIGKYLYSRLQIDNFIANEAEDTIALEAIEALKNRGLTSDQLDEELGNIVIYIFLEHILNAPKIYTNIECKDNIMEKTGLHLLKLNSQNSLFQMIFSKAYIENDLQKSIDKSFNDLSLVVNSSDRHYRFLETSILGENFDDATSNELKSIILPHKRNNDMFVDKAFGILLGYSINLDKAVNNEEFRKNLDKKMVANLQNQIPYIVEKINNLGMQNSSFYIYLLPFEDACKDKHSIMQNLVGGYS